MFEKLTRNILVAFGLLYLKRLTRIDITTEVVGRLPTVFKSFATPNTRCNKNNNIDDMFCALMRSWASDVFNQRTGIDYSPSSTNAIVISSSPPNEFTPNKVEKPPRPNSVLSE